MRRADRLVNASPHRSTRRRDCNLALPLGRRVEIGDAPKRAVHFGRANHERQAVHERPRDEHAARERHDDNDGGDRPSPHDAHVTLASRFDLAGMGSPSCPSPPVLPNETARDRHRRPLRRRKRNRSARRRGAARLPPCRQRRDVPRRGLEGAAGRRAARQRRWGGRAGRAIDHRRDAAAHHDRRQRCHARDSHAGNRSRRSSGRAVAEGSCRARRASAGVRHAGRDRDGGP